MINKRTISISCLIILSIIFLTAISGFSLVERIPRNAVEATMIECFDGTHALITIDDQEVNIRIAGVDMENYYCDWIYRREGSFWIEKILEDHAGRIYVTFDSVMPEDEEGYRMAYVYFAEHFMLNQELIMGGFAGADLTDDYAGRGMARDWQEYARRMSNGIWAASN